MWQVALNKLFLLLKIILQRMSEIYFWAITFIKFENHDFPVYSR